MSLWGPVITFGQAEQSQAPALLVTDEQITMGWVGADASGVHQDAQMLSSAGLSDRAVLPLPPAHPYAQQVYPARGGNIHLLWLDTNGESNRLYSALISPALEVLRGPVEVSDRLTLRYAAVSAGDGGLWVVWSGGILAEPAIYAQYIDSDGRPRQPALIEHGADYPAMARANDQTIYLVWLQTSPLYTYIRHATLNNGAVTAAETFAVFDFEEDTWIIDLYAGLDSTHLYVFVNAAVSQSRYPASWMVTRRLDSTVWSSPVNVGTRKGKTANVETGFNTGQARNARTGENWTPLVWARPMVGQFETLPTAAYIEGGEITVAYFQGGEAIGYQTLLPVSSLLAPPLLVTDRDRHLYITWAEPNPNGYAELKLTTTRNLSE